MISYKACYAILKNNYTQEEVKEIRTFLTQLAEIVYETKHQKDE